MHHATKPLFATIPFSSKKGSFMHTANVIYPKKNTNFLYRGAEAITTNDNWVFYSII